MPDLKIADDRERSVLSAHQMIRHWSFDWEPEVGIEGAIDA